MELVINANGVVFCRDPKDPLNRSAFNPRLNVKNK